MAEAARAAEFVSATLDAAADCHARLRCACVAGAP
jgi:hypothetical protein